MRYFLLIAILVISTPSMACLCWNDSFPLTYLNKNDTLPRNRQHYIIKGIVIDTQVGSNVFNRWGHGNLVNVRVLEFWPKDAIMNDTVTIIDDESDCASGFLRDSTYLIGAWNSNRYLGTSQCEGTSLFSKYAHLIEQLGPSGTPRTNKNYKSVHEQEKPSVRTWKVSHILTVAFGFSLLLNIILLIKRK